MADKETGSLTAAANLTGAEITHVVQGGNSRRVTIARIVEFLGSLASNILASSPRRASVGVRVLEEEVVLSGAFVDTGFRIPDRSIVLAVSSRTTVAVTGSASYAVGFNDETGKFGSGLGAAVGSANIGVIGPTAVYADRPVRVSAAGSSSFTGGRVRVSAQILTLAAPAS